MRQKAKCEIPASHVLVRVGGGVTVKHTKDVGCIEAVNVSDWHPGGLSESLTEVPENGRPDDTALPEGTVVGRGYTNGLLPGSEIAVARSSGSIEKGVLLNHLGSPRVFKDWQVKE